MPASDNRNYFPAWRVFVFGEEITDDVISVTATHQDGRAPNIAEIQLINAPTTDNSRDNFGSRSAAGGDRYVITQQDIRALYADVDLSEITLPDDKPTEADTITFAGGILGGILGGDFGAANRARNNYRKDQLHKAAARADAIDQAIRNRIEKAVDDPVKRGILLDKFSSIQRVSQPDFEQLGAVSTINNPKEIRRLQGQAHRYPFQVGDCVFHSNDPVRVFFCDPQSPEIWYHMFTGYVSDWTEEVSEDNVKTVTLVCEDVSRILRYARIATNPGIFDIDTVGTEVDTILSTFINKGFADLSLTEIMFLMVFGTSKLGEKIQQRAGGSLDQLKTFKKTYVGRDGNTTEVDISNDGAGSFNFSRSLITLLGAKGQEPASGFSEELNQRTVRLNNLAEYLALVDHQVYFSDLDNLAVDKPNGATLERLNAAKRGVARRPDGTPVISETRPGIPDVISTLGTNPDLYPVDGGRLLILAPQSLGPNTNRNILMLDPVSPATVTTWSTRLKIIYDLMERIEFSFYASPKGDLLCELPLFDFDSQDFAADNQRPEDPVDLSELARLLKSIPGAITFADNEQRGPYPPRYVIPKSEMISHARSFSDEKVRTIMKGYPMIIQAYEEGGTTARVGDKPQITILDALIPQFGARAEQCDPKGIIASDRGMKLYTELKLNQWNADARSANMRALPRVSLCFPNRPLEFQERTFVGTIRSVQHTLVWGESMETVYNVNYLRGWSGQVNDAGKLVYEPLGGNASRTLNYKQLYAPDNVTTIKERQTPEESGTGGGT